jgi:hypothetical protein
MQIGVEAGLRGDFLTKKGVSRSNGIFFDRIRLEDVLSCVEVS